MASVFSGNQWQPMATATTSHRLWHAVIRGRCCDSEAEIWRWCSSHADGSIARTKAPGTWKMAALLNWLINIAYYIIIGQVLGPMSDLDLLLASSHFPCLTLRRWCIWCLWWHYLLMPFDPFWHLLTDRALRRAMWMTALPLINKFLGAEMDKQWQIWNFPA